MLGKVTHSNSGGSPVPAFVVVLPAQSASTTGATGGYTFCNTCEKMCSEPGFEAPEAMASAMACMCWAEQGRGGVEVLLQAFP